MQDEVHPAVREFVEHAREIFGDQVRIVEGPSSNAPEVHAPAAPNLEICTHNTPPDHPPQAPTRPELRFPAIPHPRPWIIPHRSPTGIEHDEISVTRYLDGSGDFRVIKRPGWYNPDHKRTHRKKRKPLDRAIMDGDVAKRSAIRARKAARQCGMQLGVSHMITFTFAENITDIETAASVWGTFVELYRNCTPYEFHIGNYRHKVPDFEYLTVPETQSRGAWHFHCLTNCAHDIKRVRACWVAAQEHHGIERPGTQVNAKYYQTRGKRAGAVAYACKYITKEFNLGFMWKKRYWRSRGIPKPIRERYFTPEDLAVDDVRDFMESEYSGRVVWIKVIQAGPFDCIVGHFAPP